MKIPRVYEKHGAWYYLEDLAERSPTTGRPKQRWHKLCRIDAGQAALLEALKAFTDMPATTQGNLPRHLQEYTRTALGHLSIDVRREYERMYTVVATAFEAFDLDQVTPGDVLEFLDEYFPGKHTTRGHYKARLSTFFSWAVLRGHLAINPCREIKLRAAPKRKGRMTAPLFWKFHDALSPMGQCFLELLLLTRQRPTEIRLLRESAIGDTHIHFKPTKTEDSSGEEVQILITPEIRAVLERARALRPRKKVELLDRKRDPYIIQTRDGGAYSKTGLYEVWRDAVQLIGDEARGVTTRDVRPFALGLMEKAGYDRREIQLSAAHASYSTTEGYLEQHRERISSAAITLPERKT